MVAALRKAAARIASSTHYQWGHMGHCNCGFVAQEITRLTPAEIHRRAMERYGDWNEQLNDYCPTSGLPMDDVIGELIAFGFSLDDLKHLERLSDPEVLSKIPFAERNLQRNQQRDAARYLNTWALVLEEKLVQEISLPVAEKLEAVL